MIHLKYTGLRRFILRALTFSVLALSLWLCLTDHGFSQQSDTISYTYDKLNRLTGVFYSSGASIIYTYDAAGNRTSLQVTGSSSVPVIINTNPASATAGAAGITFTVNGANFVNNSVVQWNGANRSTTFVSSAQLNASIPASDLVTSGTANITVLNPGNLTSNAVAFTITSAPPTPTPTPIPVPAEITSPINGSALSSGNVVFSWNAGSGVSKYQLWLGSVPRNPNNTSVGYDIYYGDVTTATTANVTGIPEDKRVVYATLWSMINGVWQPRDYSYTAPVEPPAEMLSPAPETTLSTSATFNWGPRRWANAYQLWLGTSPSTYNIYIGPVTTATTGTVNSVPPSGQTIYVTLWTRIGKDWYSRGYTYKAPPPLAEITTPSPGTRFKSTTVTFNWSAGGSAANGYQLWIGNQPRVDGNNLIGHDIYMGPVTTATSATVKGLPTDGRLVYVTLWTKLNTDWYPKDYTYEALICTEAGAVELTSPANNSVFTSASATFKWNDNDCVSRYQLWVGSKPRDASNSPSSYDVFYGDVSGGSATLNSLPEDGRTLYVTLWSFINGQWYPKDYTYTANIRIPEITSPQHLTTFNSSQVTFNWTSVPAATDYYLWVGNGLHTYDIYSQYVFGNSTTVPNIPTDGRIIYVTIWGKINGKWYGNDYRYIACSSCAGAGTVARITDPTWGSIFTSNSRTFTWDAGVNVTQYWLFIGSTLGAYDIYNADMGAARSVTVNNLPTDGRKLYLTLFSMINGEWHQNQYVYTAMSFEKAKMVSPVDGATFSSSTATFSWDAGKNVTGYWLFVGSTPGAYDLHNADLGTALSRTVTGLPVDGRKIYVTLFSKINGEWQYNAYTYTASR